MSKFDDFFGSNKKQEPDLNFTEIGGTFACQTCDQYVLEGHYYPIDHVLVWTCSQGHKSMIENFL